MSPSRATSLATGAQSHTYADNHDDDDNNNDVEQVDVTSASLSGFEVVFQLLHRIRHEVTTFIDTPLTYEQLRQPTINFSVVRPLQVKLTGKRTKPPAPLIFGLLVCRVHFLDVADDDLAFAALNTSRADLCELLAIKLLSTYGTAPSSLELLHILTTPWNPMSGATVDAFTQEEAMDQTSLNKLVDWAKQDQTNALELAVFSKAKRFVRSPLVCQIVKSIHDGQVLYSPHAAHSALIKDDYKPRPIVQVYEWRKQPFLDHNRLRVPKIRNRLEFATFTIILILFMACQFTHDSSRVTMYEALFVLWSLGFALDELASIQENGLGIYTDGAYNVMDALFVVNFLIFLTMRLVGLWTQDEALSDLAFDVLALAACLLFPRLTISLLRGNVVLMALSAMIREYLVFMALACLTASGFLVTFVLLSRGTWSVGRVSWLLLKVWLGSSFLAFDVAQQFGAVLGPTLVTIFSIVTQTLLLTILISLLSNTFAAIQAQAETEILHQQALRTIERVKSDPLTCYVPPLNLIALLVLLPARWLASPRWMHKIHVGMTKIVNFPILLARERRSLFSNFYLQTKQAWKSLPRTIPFEGTVESISHVFDRQVTNQAFKVPSIDDDDGEEDDDDDNDYMSRQTKDSPVEPQSAANVLANPPMHASLARLATSTSSGSDRDTKNKKSVSKHIRRTPTRSQSQGNQICLPSSQSKQARLESLSSPLAKVFGSTTNVSGSIKHDELKQQQQLGLIDGKAIETRLDNIEQALQVLLGEIVRNSQVEEQDRPPLTSLTGAVEQDLGKASDDV
ncbi:hypothetical protein OIO90_000559 [Microbotryomycetes sp. JL221]|nr:hypothetical protein OIO90_000559 [Microbotryomycetes sp. JL221]